MIWGAPWALALAVAVALPFVAHLWSRRHPPAVLFPTLRFLRAASPISRRLHRVQEWPLLLLRIAIVGAICAAAAGPSVAASWRRQAWRERLHRVILVDPGLAAAPTSTVVSALRQTAASSTLLEPRAIADGLDAAILRAQMIAPRLRTELVLVWDGLRTALTEQDVADVPANVGLQLVVLPTMPGAPRAASGGTAVALELPPDARATEAGLGASLATLRLPAAGTPITAYWGQPGATALPDAPRRSPAALPAPVVRALEDMAADPRVREAAERSSRTPGHSDGAAASAASIVLARDVDGRPLLRGSSDGSGLILDYATTAPSPLTWWGIVSARESLARIGVTSRGRWTASDLASANRPAPLPPVPSLPGGLDTRAAWGVVLALLALEQFWRQRRAAATAAGGPPGAEAATAGEGSDAA